MRPETLSKGWKDKDDGQQDETDHFLHEASYDDNLVIRETGYQAATSQITVTACNPRPTRISRTFPSVLAQGDVSVLRHRWKSMRVDAMIYPLPFARCRRGVKSPIIRGG